MPLSNFFDYFPASPKVRRWPVYSTAFGRVTVPPQSPYPPARHPEGHHFAWEQGRILHEYQLLFISQGGGYFESSQTGVRRVKEGSAFLLFPGVWHRYRPDKGTGWTEQWIEVQGPVVDGLRRSRIIDDKHPLHRVHALEQMVAMFDEAEKLARCKPPGFTVRLGMLAMQIVALLQWETKPHPSAPRRITRVVAEAQALFAQHVADPLAAEVIARQMGVGYSYFRRVFKRETGLSPKQYQIEIRHRQTRNMLRGTDSSIKEIAEQLGYNSPYHLSFDFSKRAGMSPTQWRLSTMKGG